LIPADAVIVNGQSGDYITGGHLKENLLSSRSRADLLAAIREKHFGLWRPLLTAAHRDAIDSLVVDAIGAAPEAIESGALPLWKAGFGWEWQERQAKFVVNGQRAYEFFGYDWALPLWDDGVIDFWSRIPPRLLLGQALYRNFLEKMNFFGVFRDFPVKVWRWPGASIAFVPIARAAALMFGSRAKARVYAVAGYWGHTRYLWAQYGFAEYRRHLAVLRNYHSLNARSVLARLARSLGRERDLDAALMELGIAERA
jgi:asparagine synthase (glutamine-hydrolysing)